MFLFAGSEKTGFPKLLKNFCFRVKLGIKISSFDAIKNAYSPDIHQCRTLSDLQINSTFKSSK